MENARRQFLETLLAGGVGLALEGCTVSRGSTTESKKEGYDFSDLKEAIGERWKNISYDEAGKSREKLGEYQVGRYNRATDFITNLYNANLNGDVNKAKERIKSWSNLELERYKTMLPWINFENPLSEDAYIIERLEVMESLQ
jgi:hypothetical protein